MKTRTNYKVFSSQKGWWWAKEGHNKMHPFWL